MERAVQGSRGGGLESTRLKGHVTCKSTRSSARHMRAHLLHLPRNLHARFTKCCSCSKRQCSKSKKYSTCDELCASRFTKCYPCATSAAQGLQGPQSTVPATKSAAPQGPQSAAPVTKPTLQGLQTTVPATKSALQSSHHAALPGGSQQEHLQR